MTETAPREHPDANVLGRFVEGTLTGGDLRAVADHLRDCEECRVSTGEAARFEREEQPIRQPRHVFRWLAGTAAAVALIAIVAIPLRTRFSNPIDRLPIDRRAVEGRISAMKYTPYGATRGQSAESYRAIEVLADLEEDARKKPTAENLHRLAMAELAVGRAQKAAERLERALTLQPESAAIRSDLAVAQLALGEAAASAENAARALKRDSAFAPAAFNWALALEALANRRAAIDAWEQYLALDSSSQWAEEARGHLRRLRAQSGNSWPTDRKVLHAGSARAAIEAVVSRHPQRVRGWMQDELLPRFAAQRSREDFALAETIADIRARGGDPFLADVVRTCNLLTPTLAAAFEQFSAARKIGVDDIPRATEHLQASLRLFESESSPMAIVASILIATNDFYSGKSAEALKRLDLLAERKRELLERYPAALAEMQWVRGLVFAATGRPDEALAAYEAALAAARRAGEVEHETVLLDIVANLMDMIGDAGDAYRLRLESIHRIESLGNDSKAYNAYGSATLAELAAGRPHVALAYNRTQFELARKVGRPLLLAEASIHGALSARDVGDLADAEKRVQDALRNAAAVTPEALRDRVTADIHFVSGVIEKDRHPAKSIDALTRALSIWEKWDWRMRPAAGHLVRGEAYLAAGNDQQAEADFRAGIAEIERQRTTLDEPSLRIAYFERADALFDRLTALLVKQGREEDALTVVERKRARTLLDQMTWSVGTAARAEPLTPPDLVRSLPAGVALIEFSPVDGEWFIWLIRSRGITTKKVPIERARIERTAQDFAKAIQNDDQAAIRRHGKSLYETLFAPIATSFADASTLVIVPDASVSAIPFAALVTSDDEYLVQKRAIVVAPSASTFVRSIQIGENKRTLLGVAAGAPPGLPPLARAESEIRDSAALYETATVLSGREATRQNFETLAPLFDIIHFAGHAVVDPANPSRSWMAFTGSEDSVRLSAREISRVPLPRAPLVILNACGTGRGKPLANEGTPSIARAFLQAGARAVVGTLWDVDDEASSKLVKAFHRELRSGASPSRALRAAQLAMIDAGGSHRLPSSWAAAQLIGSM